MATRQFNLTQEQDTELRVAYDQCKEAAVSKKLLGIRLYGTGHPVVSIVDMLGCSRTSLMNWCSQYEADGVSGLADKRAGGNSRKLSRSQRAELREQVHRYTPRQLLGQEAATATGQNWTPGDLHNIIYQWYGVVYQSPSSYWLLLGECGLSYQRTEKVFQSRSEFKVADFEEALEKN
jgi:transposase